MLGIVVFVGIICFTYLADKGLDIVREHLNK